MELKSIFVDRWNTLRSGWRFAIFFSTFIFLAVTSTEVLYGALTAFGIPLYEGSKLAFVVVGMIWLIPGLFVGWLCGKFLEGLPFRALGAWFTSNWLRHLLLGLVIGAFSVGFAVMIAVIFGGLSFEFNTDYDNSVILRTLLSSFLVFGVRAALEEAVFRGYVFQTFSRASLAWLAIVLTSVPFGLVHLDNPSATTASVLNTVLAGIWFGVAYLKTRDLWFVWGMHLTWNWVQGAIFGIEVSGLTDITTAPLLKEIDKGPTWLTGETYGIEGGVACTIAIIASIAFIYFLPILKPSEEMLALSEPPAVAGGLT
jgi:uncharacterized protein